MRLESTAFINNGTIPKEFTCDGRNVPPIFAFVDAPQGTRSMALVMEDPDAPKGNFTHWLIWNIDPQGGIISGDYLSADTKEGTNDAGMVGYTGPCPPSGRHRYIFTLYALGDMLSLPVGSSKDELLRSMTGFILDKAKFIGFYAREKPHGLV